jgi:hypothetical protein
MGAKIAIAFVQKISQNKTLLKKFELTFGLTGLDQIQHIDLKSKLVRTIKSNILIILKKKYIINLPIEPFQKQSNAIQRQKYTCQTQQSKLMKCVF